MSKRDWFTRLTTTLVDAKTRSQGKLLHLMSSTTLLFHPMK